MGFLFLSFLFFFASKSFAQEDNETQNDTREEEEAPKVPLRTYNDIREASELFDAAGQPHRQIVTSSKIIYERNDSKVEPNHILSVLVGFENTGAQTFVITDICAALTSLGEEPQYLRNYSALRPNVTVNSHEIHTLEYRFQVDDKTNPNEYGFVVAVFYHIANGTEYTTFAVNSTLVIVDAPVRFGARTFLVVLAVFILLVVLAVYRRNELMTWARYAYKQVREGNFRGAFRRTRAAPQERHRVNTGNPEKDRLIQIQRQDEDEWLSGTANYKYIKKERQRKHQSQSPSRDTPKPRGRSPVKRH